jgi:hypothetical protein
MFLGSKLTGFPFLIDDERSGPLDPKRSPLE